MIRPRYSGSTSVCRPEGNPWGPSVLRMICVTIKQSYNRGCCDRSVTSPGILYILVAVMLVLTSVRKIGAVIFLAAITIAPLTHMVAIIIALAIDAHHAGVGILIVSIIHGTSPIDITLNGAVASLVALSNRVSDLVALAALTERARARLRSMAGGFANRAVIWAACVICSMRFRAAVSAYHEWATFAGHMSDCLAFLHSRNGHEPDFCRCPGVWHSVQYFGQQEFPVRCVWIRNDRKPCA